MHDVAHSAFAGILLAAGRGRRFDPLGARSKMLAELPGGERLAVASALALRRTLPTVVAVVGPDSDELAAGLTACGCRVTTCMNAHEGMAASLVHGLKQVQQAQGWVVALADMPFVQSATIAALADVIDEGAQIAVPVYRGRRGNPVAFSRAYLPELLNLRGDEGARRLLKRFPVVEVIVDDPGICHDIDTPADLQKNADGK